MCGQSLRDRERERERERKREIFSCYERRTYVPRQFISWREKIVSKRFKIHFSASNEHCRLGTATLSQIVCHRKTKHFFQYLAKKNKDKNSALK